MDQNYRNLLTHLQRTTNNLPSGVIPALIHHLGTVPLPLPTTLTASVVASPVWKEENLQSVLVAFRQSVHLKARTLLEDPNAGFSLSPGPAWKFRSWLKAICSGARIGPSRVRVAALGGLLIGLEEVKEQLDAGGARFKVEDEVTIAVAEYFDEFNGSWPSEHGSKSKSSNVMLYMISDVMLLVSEKKMRVLNLPGLFYTCLKAINSAFEGGNFIAASHEHDSKDSTQTDESNQLPRIARLASRCIDILSDNSDRRSTNLWAVINETLAVFKTIVTALEHDWIQSPLSNSREESTIPSEAAARGVNTWTKLKGLLFTTVMVLQSVVDALLYNESITTSSNAYLASDVIKIFSHIAFISSKFGGLSAQGEGSFREYRRTYYTSLDIVLASPPCSEDLAQDLAKTRKELKNVAVDSVHPVLLASTVYFFTTVEQSIDQISAQCLLEEVLPICREYLGSPEHREAFESSHSVVLALFASVTRTKENDSSRLEALRLMIPFYTSSLLACSEDGKLNTEQLRLAFSSLVFGASALQDGGALAWFCIEFLLEETKRLQSLYPDRKEQYTRLVLTSISLIPSLSSSPALLPRLLAEVQDLVIREHGVGRNVLLEAIYEEILRRVGDDQRQQVLGWWFDSFGNTGPNSETLAYK